MLVREMHWREILAASFPWCPDLVLESILSMQHAAPELLSELLGASLPFNKGLASGHLQGPHTGSVFSLSSRCLLIMQAISSQAQTVSSLPQLQAVVSQLVDLTAKGLWAWKGAPLQAAPEPAPSVSCHEMSALQQAPQPITVAAASALHEVLAHWSFAHDNPQSSRGMSSKLAAELLEIKQLLQGMIAITLQSNTVESSGAQQAWFRPLCHLAARLSLLNLSAGSPADVTRQTVAPDHATPAGRFSACLHSDDPAPSAQHVRPCAEGSISHDKPEFSSPPSVSSSTLSRHPGREGGRGAALAHAHPMEHQGLCRYGHSCHLATPAVWRSMLTVQRHQQQSRALIAAPKGAHTQAASVPFLPQIPAKAGQCLGCISECLAAQALACEYVEASSWSSEPDGKHAAPHTACNKRPAGRLYRAAVAASTQDPVRAAAGLAPHHPVLMAVRFWRMLSWATACLAVEPVPSGESMAHPECQVISPRLTEQVQCR